MARILDLASLGWGPACSWTLVGANTPTLKLPLGKFWQLPLPGVCGPECRSPLRGSLFLTLFSLVHYRSSGQAGPALWPAVSLEVILAVQVSQ